MNQKIFKQLGVLLSFLLVFAQMSFAQPLSTDAAALERAVTITALDLEGESIVETEAVEFQEGDTAWDILEEVEADLEYSESEWGKMLEGIDGVFPDFDDNDAFWGFYVNGVSASVGLDSYEVSHGDNVLVAVTDNSSENVNVTVSAVDEDEEKVVDETKVELSSHATAYDAVVQATDSVEVSIDDQYFSMINNINKYDMADNNWWEIYSNEEALSVGALSHQVQSGEHIQLKLQVFDDGLNEEDEKDIEDESETIPENEDDKDTDNESSDDESGNTSDKLDDKDSETPEKESADEVKVSNLSKKDLKKIEKDIDILTNKILNENLATEYGNEWWVWGLGLAGEKAPSSYKKNIEKELKETKGDLGAVTELEKVIIALSSQGYDATNIAGYNLIEMLEDHPGLENPVVNSAIYALIAFNSGDYEVDAKVEKEMLQSVLDAELENGGWTFFGNEISVDITGMALIALGHYKDNDDVKEKIDRAVNALSKEQKDNGGFYEEFNGGYTSEAASQVIMGLISVGVDPTGASFTKKEGNLIEYLLTFRTDNGYLHVWDDKETGAFPDQQALLALAFIQNHLKTQDSDDEGSTPGKDTEKDKNKVTVEKNKPTTVKPGQTVEVQGTKISIKMPKNLPKDAKIEVRAAKNVDSGNLKVAGEVVEIDLLDADGNPIKGEFTLTLGIDKALIGEDVSIYYFDEETNTWKHVGGTVNKDGTITATVPHFSIYGVFLTAESDKEDKEDKGDKDEENGGSDTKGNDEDNGNITDVKVDEDDESAEGLKSSNELPDTATNMFNFIAIGLFISLIGIALMFIQRKRSNQS